MIDLFSSTASSLPSRAAAEASEDRLTTRLDLEDLVRELAGMRSLQPSDHKDDQIRGPAGSEPSLSSREQDAAAHRLSGCAGFNIGWSGSVAAPRFACHTGPGEVMICRSTQWGPLVRQRWKSYGVPGRGSSCRARQVCSASVRESAACRE